MSDVHAAAERWRLDNKAEEHKEYARSPYKGNFDLRLDDAYLLAEAYMTERHADDAERKALARQRIREILDSDELYEILIDEMAKDSEKESQSFRDSLGY